MGQLYIDTSVGEKRMLLRSPMQQLPKTPVVEETARASVEAKRAKRYGLTASDLPAEVLDRVLEFLASSNVVFSNCGSCDLILEILDGVTSSYTAISLVCRGWSNVLRSSRRITPEAWHDSVFGIAGGKEDIVTRMAVLKSYQSLMKEMHQTPVEKRRALRGRVERTMEKVVGLKWMLQMEFAGLFWNHEQPPVEDLTRLEGYCNHILAGGALPTRDDELCTTVDDAVGNNALVHEFDASKFIVLFMSKRQPKAKAAATPAPSASAATSSDAETTDESDSEQDEDEDDDSSAADGEVVGMRPPPLCHQLSSVSSSSTATTNTAMSSPCTSPRSACHGSHHDTTTATTGSSNDFQVVFDQIKGWRRDNSINFSGTKVLTPNTSTSEEEDDEEDGAGGLLGSLPWDVQMEFGNCNLCSSHISKDREIFCLFSLSNYSGFGYGTKLLLLGRLPQFSFHDETQAEGFSCSMPII